MAASGAGKRSRLIDVSAMTGVSVATVSRSLTRPDTVKRETLERVQRAAASLGYVPRGAARALASGRSGTVGAVIPTLDHAIFARAIQALQRALASADLQLLVGAHEYAPQTEHAVVRAMLTRGVDALVLVGGDHLDRTWDLLARSDVPVLLTWSHNPRYPSIWFDNIRAGRLAAEHLLDLGHRRFGVITGHRRWNDRARMRVQGAFAALAERGIALLEQNVIEEPFTLAGGRDGMAQLLASAEPPTAVICGNDLLAAGALFEARSRQLAVPGQVSIVGIDNLEIAAHLWPPLTTVHLPTARLGEEAAQLIGRMLRAESVSPEVELPIELVIRRSSGPAGQ